MLGQHPAKQSQHPCPFGSIMRRCFRHALSNRALPGSAVLLQLTFLEKIMPSESHGFRQARSQAESYAQDKGKTGQLVGDVLAKAYKHRGQLQSIWEDLMSLCRMLKAWSRGQYKSAPWRTIVFSLATVIYFLNPLDLAPDFIPGIGYLDDAVVLGFVVNSVRRELNAFLQWEREAEPD